jgi:hypothetical protein
MIPALIAVAQAGYQLYKSEDQKKKASKLKDNNYVPSAVNEAVNSARIDSNSSSPHFARGLEKIKQSSASSINTAKSIGGSTGQIQQSVANIDAHEKESLKDLEVYDSAYRTERKNNLQNLLMMKGSYQKDSRDAYDAARSALIGASERNQYNAFSTALEGVATAIPDSAYSRSGKATEPGFAPPTIGKRSGSIGGNVASINGAAAGALRKKGLARMGSISTDPGPKPFDPNMFMDQAYNPNDLHFAKY